MTKVFVVDSAAGREQAIVSREGTARTHRSGASAARPETKIAIELDKAGIW
jgi:hypothetical protein